MSKYTTSIRWIVEMYTEEMEGLPITDRIKASLPRIFDFDFPMYSEEHRTSLERKIIMHYFNKEIGAETFGLWKFWLEERLNLIMPKYIEIYKTTNFDYLKTFSENETYTSNRKSDGQIVDTSNLERNDNGSDLITTSVDTINNSNGDVTSNAINSDFPQGNINGIDYASTGQDVNTKNKQDDKIHSSSTNTTDKNNKVTSKTNTNSDRIDNTTENYTRHKEGYNGKSTTELNMEYRNSIINIDNMIISELKDLFMLIY